MILKGQRVEIIGGTTVPGPRGNSARYAKRRPGRGCAVDRARPGRPGSMRGTWPRTPAQPRNPDDVPARRRTAMTRPLQRMLSARRRERAVREGTGRRAGEQAALRRVAALAAGAAAPEEIFAAAAEELARLPGADIAAVLRYESDETATVLGCWSASGVPACTRRRLTVAGEGAAVPVPGTGRPARATRFAGPPGSVSDCLGRAGMRAGRGSPVVVGGRPWGGDDRGVGAGERAAGRHRAPAGGLRRADRGRDRCPSDVEPSPTSPATPDFNVRC
jgi:hypothetical protein